MSQQAELFRNPLFRWGMPAMTSLMVIGIAFFVVEDQMVRVLMLLVAALDILVTPQILERAARSA